MDRGIVTIFGAAGFVGSAIVERLARAGYRIRACTRKPNEALFLKPIGDPGQIEPLYCDLGDQASIKRVLDGADVAINCVGILYEAGGGRNFSKIQGEAPGVIGKLAKKAGVETLIHISAIGASDKSPAKYARTKAAGEKAVKKAFKDAIIFRPSIIFGPRDNFFNQFAKMAKTPLMPVSLVGPKTKFQPVYVEDVARAVTKAVLYPGLHAGKIYELGGPRTYTFRALMDYMLEVIERDTLIMTIPGPIAALMGFFFQTAAKILPVPPPITLDQVRMLKTDNVVGEKAKGFEAFGIAPEPIEAVVPDYLGYLRPKGQFE